jgi:peptidoglycan-associated lipoprotein
MKNLILAASMFALVGCAAQQAAVVPDVAEPSKPAPAKAAAPAPTPVAAVDQKQADLDALLKGLVIQFGFDAANLTPESRSRLDALADALRANPKAQIRIAGNCDELGTVEYNLALGQKRADAVAQYLVTLGVAGNRVDTVSYGEEKPVDPRSNEAAYTTNRRAELAPKQAN